MYRELPLEAAMPQVFVEWKKWLLGLEAKPENTVDAYSQGVRRFVSFAEIPPGELNAEFPSCKSRPLESPALRKANLINIVRDMMVLGDLSKSTLNQTLSALKSFYDYCKVDGQIELVPDLNEIRKMGNLRVDQQDPDYFRPGEIRQLYDAANGTGPDPDLCDLGRRIRWPSRDLAMCSFLAVLGLRAEELAKAEVWWISEEQTNVSSSDAASDGEQDYSRWILHVEGKGKRVRRLPLSPELVEAYKRWECEREEHFGRAGPTDPLFVTNHLDKTTQKAVPFNYRRLLYWLRTLNRAAGLREFGLHALRHTAGVQLAIKGRPVNVIQGLLGHKSIATTGIYTELAANELFRSNV